MILGITILAILCLSIGLGLLFHIKKDTDKQITRFQVVFDALREDELVELYKKTITKELREKIIHRLKYKYEYGDTKIKKLESSLQERQSRESKRIQSVSRTERRESSSNTEHRSIRWS